jgi:CelD/BcsL family acetyltransferase involved in cellulose biosynthesis
MRKGRFGTEGGTGPGEADTGVGAAVRRRRAKETDSPDLIHPIAIEREADFQALRDPWNRLARETDPASVFLRHEWIDAARQWPFPGDRLLILAFWRGDQLVGACPLRLATRRQGRSRVRHLGFLRVPDTQECDIPMAADYRRAVVQGLSRWLRQTKGWWDILDLNGFRPSSPTPELLFPALRRAGLPVARRAPERNSRVDLDGDWETYYRGLGRRLKKNNNLVANRLQSQGEIAIHRGSDEAAVEKAVTVSARSWKKARGVSLDEDGPRAFIQRLSAHAERLGWLSVWLLELNGKPVAMEYQLTYAGRVHALRGDFDQAFDELSPGSHLQHRLLAELFGDPDARTYLMGPGDNAYKRRWTDQGEELTRLRAWSPSLRGRWRHFLDQGVAPLARRALGAARRVRDGFGEAKQ